VSNVTGVEIGPNPSTGASGWENYPNLRRRPHAPAAGRGRLQRQIRRCFVLFGPEVSSSRLLDWCYVSAVSGARHHWSVRRILEVVAERVGRAPSAGRPWIWRLRNSQLPADTCQAIDIAKDKQDDG
jgi:hypothetical protein